MGTTAITCIDCGEIRHAPNASKHLIKRCKSCQDEFNRERALQRYYERTGKKKKAKAKKKAKTKAVTTDGEESPKCWDIGPRKETAKVKKPTKSAFTSDEECQAFLKEIAEKLYGPGHWDKIPNDGW